MRQLRGDDRLGRGGAVESRRTKELRARTATADRVVKSVCPYCAVGCAQNVFVKDDEIVQMASGAMLLAGSAPTRLGIFAAGMESAHDPKYTVRPRRERLEAKKAGES